MGGFCGGSSSKASSPKSVSSSKSSYKPSSTPVKKRSAGRGSGANKTARQTVQSVTRNIGTDLKMGLSTFGMSKDRQAEKLSQMGYSPKAIDSYQARTAASRERMRESMSGGGYDYDGSQAPDIPYKQTTAPDIPYKQTTAPGFTGQPPSAPAPIGEDMSAPEAGSAEEEVVEGAKKRKGRASTIATAPTGLLTTARTRRRRSLMGGDEPRGLIS